MGNCSGSNLKKNKNTKKNGNGNDEFSIDENNEKTFDPNLVKSSNLFAIEDNTKKVSELLPRLEKEKIRNTKER